MRLPALPSLVALALALALAPGRAQAKLRLEPRQVFRFAAGTALFAPPGVGKDGSVYVGTGDGYLHALGPDGSFRWSYTVKGRIVAPAVEEGSTGRVFVATSDARLYAFEPDARLRWVFPLPVAPKSELALSPKGTLLFVGKDDHLYGVTTSGALVLRLAAPSARSAPAILSDGRAALILDGSIAILKGYGFERAPLPGVFAPGARLLLTADRSVFACEDGKSLAFGPSAELGSARDCVAPPVQAGGFVAVAEASGSVRLVYPSGEPNLVPLGALPLRPVWDAARRRLILSTATGRLSVLEVSP
ncbi:MAG TPA: PQQ-binding-like beta-propeller repeat protein [Polyangiaceae bacterium]